MTWLICPAKQLRAAVIAAHVRAVGYPGVVVFTCGNAAEALREAIPEVDVLEIGPHGPLVATRWWSVTDIARTWPGHFDATPGHLPMPLMLALAGAIQGHVGPLQGGAVYLVPTGSGETVMALRWAYPASVFAAVYNVRGREAATKHEAQAPLTPLVAATGPVVDGTLRPVPDLPPALSSAEEGDARA